MDMSEWSGDAANYSDADAYCSACLIDLNASGETKVKGLCILPVKKAGSKKVNANGVLAAAGGHGLMSVKKPEGVTDKAFAAAKKKAARAIVRMYKQMDRLAPEVIYQLAGEKKPEKK
jgi:hypothetical protein